VIETKDKGKSWKRPPAQTREQVERQNGEIGKRGEERGERETGCRGEGETLSGTLGKPIRKSGSTSCAKKDLRPRSEEIIKRYVDELHTLPLAEFGLNYRSMYAAIGLFSVV
jgi:hypothetical protein